MKIWHLIWLSLLPLTGATAGILAPAKFQQRLKLFLSFSGGFLFTVTISALLPELYGKSEWVPHFILGGFFLQLFLEAFTRGAEHGHLHIHDHGKNFPVSLFVALSFHAFLEAMSLGTGLLPEARQDALAFGIGLHEVPAAFALLVVIRAHGSNSNTMRFWAILYAMMAPTGYLCGAWFGAQAMAGDFDNRIALLMALVVGTFFHISTTILFENTPEHRFSAGKILSILLGVGLALAVSHAE